jgi:protein SERAC1
VLVDMHSATQGTTLKKGKGFVEAINRNHSDMVKFRRNDEDYERAIGHLKRMVHQAVVTLPNRSRND